MNWEGAAERVTGKGRGGEGRVDCRCDRRPCAHVGYHEWERGPQGCSTREVEIYFGDRLVGSETSEMGHHHQPPRGPSPRHCRTDQIINAARSPGHGQAKRMADREHAGLSHSFLLEGRGDDSCLGYPPSVPNP